VSGEPGGIWLTKAEIETVARALGAWGHRVAAAHLFDSDGAGADPENLALGACAAAPGLRCEHVVTVVRRTIAAWGTA